MPRKLPDDIDQEYYERRITLRVSDALHGALMDVAHARGRSMNDLAGDILHQYLAAQEESDVLRHLKRAGERHKGDIASLRRGTVDPERRVPSWLDP